MSPRLVLCLFLAVAGAIVAFGWTLAAGGGFILALAAYSVVGTVVLVGSTSLAVLMEQNAPRTSAMAARLAARPVTARSG